VNELGVVGAGSWGTALAIALAPRFERVVLWARDAELARDMREKRENRRYLPGAVLPEQVNVTAELQDAAAGMPTVLTAVPSRYLRAQYQALLPYLSPETILVSATKGIETGTLLRMSEVIDDTLGSVFAPRVAVLSGPTFAKEVAAGEPAAVVIASSEGELASHVQAAFSGPALRLYTSRDVVGVEIGAALKNVIAIGAGICHGLGLGGNSVAALVTRGLAELTRLAVALGGEARTLAGLAGLGDMVLTSTGDLSRNRYVGVQLAKGRPLDEIVAGMDQIAEGVDTCKAAHELAQRTEVEMPIAEAMYEILYLGKPVERAIRDLMERPLTNE
jgi:glycerol-3-phosphate dehydrogenase (NAD(P)+)